MNAVPVISRLGIKFCFSVSEVLAAILMLCKRLHLYSCAVLLLGLKAKGGQGLQGNEGEGETDKGLTRSNRGLSV